MKLKITLMSVRELAIKLNVPLSAIYQMTHKSEIPYVKIGGRLRFVESEINNWIEDNQVQKGDSNE